MKQMISQAKWLRTLLIVVVAGGLLTGGIVLGIHFSNANTDGPTANGKDTVADPDLDPNAQQWQGKKETSDAGTSVGIAIPGFKSMTFAANSQEQAVNFYNPKSNDCYFVLTLLLPDGTQLYKSKMIEPGKGLYTITLDTVPPKGDYPDAVLKYECFKRNDELTQLNGSEMVFELIVK